MQSALKIICVLTIGFTALSCVSTGRDADQGGDPYAAYVWPPPPDQPRIRLETIIAGRLDVEASSKWQRVLLGSEPRNQYDFLKKPFAIAIDRQGRVIVSDPFLRALLRFDRKARRMDVFGTTGTIKLRFPLGMCLGSDGTLYVADPELHKVLAYDSEGTLKGVIGTAGELTHPTDVAISPDGTKAYIADSKEHRVVVFDLKTGKKISSFGKLGSKDGEFNYPTALAFDRNRRLFVVDQLNARIQVFTEDGEFVDQMGERGIGFGKFVRPKDIAVDAQGVIYVTDAAFNNVQIFDPEGRLLTFVGEGGEGPGQFQTPGGVAVNGNEFAVIDQTNHRVQIFRYIAATAGK